MILRMASVKILSLNKDSKPPPGHISSSGFTTIARYFNEAMSYMKAIED
jgi:hypothetical protein